jgi:hypothetical protein
LGEVLSQQGLVNEAALDEALTEQKELRDRRVGEIIAEKAEVPQIVVEQAIDNAHKNGKSPKARVGDILVEAGLVTNQQVEESLQEQASGKRKRICLILIEKGQITGANDKLRRDQAGNQAELRGRRDYPTCHAAGNAQHSYGRYPEDLPGHDRSTAGQ